MLGCEAEALGEFIGGRGAAEFGAERVVQPREFAQPLRAPDGDAHGARLFRDRAMDALFDPDRRVGRELRAELRIVKFRRAQQPEIALGDKVRERQAEAGVVIPN